MSCCCEGPEVWGHRLDSGDDIGPEDVPECCGAGMDQTARDGGAITYTCGACRLVLETADETVDRIYHPAGAAV